MRILIMITMMLLASSGVQAGTLSPGLQRQIDELEAGALIKVLVVMHDQVDVRTLDLQLHEAKATLAFRHQTVVGLLQDRVKNSQAGLLADLQTKKHSGQITGYKSHWLINAVVVLGTVAAVEELAARNDVEVVEADLVPKLIQPLMGDPSAAAVEGRGIGLTPGLRAINAPRVWEELGIDGTGVIVGNLDTGVDGLHPALSSRWRGNFAPPEECWLDVLNSGSPDFPADLDETHGHGTHVMGTITGLAADDTIGVAPGALWIASNPVAGGGASFDNYIISALEFMTDPDGDAQTMADVPAVVQNSWGVHEYFGYFDCDSRWWDAIDNCEAAGVVLTWSAGNSGADGPETILSPADRAASFTNSFSVGSTSAYAPYSISYFSSLGPSGCGGQYAIKPEVCAPGSDIYSAQPGGGYQVLSGTSMAGPHVAGVVALMRAANPDVDVITIKEVLMATAIDLGVQGEDNTYGRGFVDAYAAVLAVSESLGSVVGTVTDIQTSEPIAGVLISITEVDNFVYTDEFGAYEIFGFAGPAEINFTFYGYETSTLSLNIEAGEAAIADQAMVSLQVASLTGVVYDAFGAAVVGATVTMIDLPIAEAVTNSWGEFSFLLAIDPAAPYQIKATAAGQGTVTSEVVFSGSMVVDLHLQITEGFESGDFSLFPWESGVLNPWLVDSIFHYDGAFSARSPLMSGLGETWLSVEMDVVLDGNLGFQYKMNSNEGNHLVFRLDGEPLGQWFGQGQWQEFSTPVTVGHHTFTWVFEENGAPGSAMDMCWVDYIQFPPAIVPGTPVISVDPAFVAVEIPPESSTQSSVTVYNTGDGVLEITVFINTGSDTPASRSTLGQGGPDNFGYRWGDNTAVGGPQYEWVDITAVGILLGDGNDTNHGPFDLGFDFPFYESSFDQVRITSNGFLSFTWFLAPFTNQPIPSGGPPNDLLAVFWDDLNPDAGGNIYYFSDLANNRFVVQYDGVYLYGTEIPQTFEVILNANGDILYQYQDVASTESCTVGIENGVGDDGLQVAFNEPYLQNDLALRFSTGSAVPWLEVSPQQGAVAPGESLEIILTLDSHGLAEGEHQAGITILCDDPANETVEIPIALTVSSLSPVQDSLPRSVRLSGGVPNPFNPATDIKFSLPKDSAVRLEIYDLSGRLVRSLHSGVLRAGLHSVHWSGSDNQGQVVASGKFFARLLVDGQVLVRPLILVR